MLLHNSNYGGFTLLEILDQYNNDILENWQF